MLRLIDYRKALQWGYIGYLIIIGFLAFTLIKGTIGMGGQRWIGFAFVKVQPQNLQNFFSLHLLPIIFALIVIILKIDGMILYLFLFHYS